MKRLLFIVMLSFAITGYAQKIKLVQGSLGPLKGETAINVEFTYDNLTVGKNKPEDEYIEEKKKEYNDKEAGKGDTWERNWSEDRKARYEPKFRELFSEHSKLSTIDENAKYTMIYHTTRIEPGFNVGVASRPAMTDAEILIVETANRDNVIAKITLFGSPGSQAFGMDFDTGVRIAESYAKAGKSLGGFFKKNTK